MPSFPIVAHGRPSLLLAALVLLVVVLPTLAQRSAKVRRIVEFVRSTVFAYTDYTYEFPRSKKLAKGGAVLEEFQREIFGVKLNIRLDRSSADKARWKETTGWDRARKFAICWACYAVIADTRS